jgi:hypothetical protein
VVPAVVAGAEARHEGDDPSRRAIKRVFWLGQY